LLEDYALGALMEEVTQDELFEGDEALAVYQRYLVETQ
jgi:hypothetical protein